jgi:hypothetical protein
LLILVAVLGAVLVLLFLSVPAVQRRLGWQSAATPQLPAARSGQ